MASANNGNHRNCDDTSNHSKADGPQAAIAEHLRALRLQQALQLLAALARLRALTPHPANLAHTESGPLSEQDIRQLLAAVLVNALKGNDTPISSKDVDRRRRAAPSGKGSGSVLTEHQAFCVARCASSCRG